jgi:hypothetical protein
MEQELKLLKRFEEDSEWFHNNIDKLRRENFTGKFVAIKNKKPIASDNNLDVMIESIAKKGENPSYLFIEFVYPEGTILLL